MKTFSRFLIWALGTRLYLRIPQKLRRRLGMHCGEDLSTVNELLRKLQEARPGKNDAAHSS